MGLFQWLTFILPIITGVASWFAGRRVRNNSTLDKLQTTIDMLVCKNTELYNKVVDLNAENAALKKGQEEMKLELQALRKKIMKGA
ncbi:MAG: hypothetical protein PHH23_06645 [Paludibacteraceae bacterium]|nr:hypothetical protein [Paludibacteraceae bacterium]